VDFVSHIRLDGCAVYIRVAIRILARRRRDDWRRESHGGGVPAPLFTCRWALGAMKCSAFPLLLGWANGGYF